MVLEAGRVVGERYRLLGPLGEGRQGTVWEAVDLLGERGPTVAVKFGHGAQLRVEGEALLTVEHRSLPRAYDVGLHGADAFVVLERIWGEHLGASLGVAGVARAALAVAEGLWALHRAGIVHGDVKPSNVLVGEARCCLVDLGLARSDGAVSGTLAYMAPEVLAGERGPASDLYALGVMLFQCLGGGHPFVAEPGDPAAVLAAVTQRGAVRSEVLAKVPEALRGALLALVAWDPERRTRSAAAWASRWREDAAGFFPVGTAPAAEGVAEGTPRPRVALCGREGERGSALAALERALAGDGLGVLLEGPPGAGKQRLLEEVLRAARIRGSSRGDALDVRGELPPTVHRPTVVCLTDARAEALGPLLEALRRLRRYAVGRAPAVLLASTSDGVDAGDLTRVVVGALDRARTAELLQELYGLRPPPAVLDAWLDTTAGMPGRLVSLACALGPAGLQASRDALAARAATLHRPSAPEGLSPAALTLLAFLVALETPAATGALRALLGGDPHGPLAELVGAGAVTLGPERVTCHARLAPEAFPSALRARCADALERHAGALGGPEAVRLAQAALLRGDGPAAWAHAARACADPELSRSEAIRWLERTASGAPDPEAHALRLARARVLSGDASRALEDLAALPPSATVRALETDALRRAGRRDEARAVAARLLAEGDPSVRAVGALCLARDALDRGDLQGAQERLAGGLGDAEGVPPELQPRALEVGGLVALATGALDRCRARMERCDQRALALGDNVQRARARSVLGMLRLREGDAPGARRLFEDAFALASQEGDTLAGATYLLNLAGAELDTGDLGASLRGLERSVEGFAAVGRYGDLGRALANLSSLLELLGAAGEAREVAGRAVEAAGRHGDALTEAVAGCVLASLDPDRARGAEAMLQGARAVASAGDPARADEWRARTASRMVSLGDLSRAEEALPTGPGGALTALARAELLLHRGDSVALEEGLRAAQEAVGRDPSLEHQLLLGRLAERALGALGRHEEASRMRARARARVSTLAETLPARLAGAFLDAWQGHQEVPEARPAAGATEGSWRRLAGIAQRLNRETRLGPLLEIVMDAVIDLTGASRGFVLLRDEAHALRVRTARNMARQDLEGEDAHLSRSVAERVALSGEALLTVDATADGRLDAAESVHAMRLRSILAVPLTAQGEVQGCIYLDERYRAGAFGEGALEVARAFADAAGLALHNARTRHALRRALRRAERLSHQLERQVDAQRMELEVARQTLSAEGLRGRYDGILGRGPAMTKLLGLVDRVAPTAMSVLLQGESGTGKELVARALHGNSPRASRPFVAENCGAIPETLLESVLFGHVRGAFTGADRSRPGLFEVADGGTLFLDEVGETSPGMQARLLRVLQDGEVRPVGGERTRKVDVRVLAATHRNLAEMVRAGTFREDLYYRLAVVVLPVPALRERREDIPALVSHFLARHGGGVTLDRGALARLVGAPWPGNVRQLENELKRACVLADGVVREADLSPELVLAGASASGTTDAPRGPLDLRGAVEDTERELVTKALQEHHWNQSRAAAALGLSRFGLQKKLKRLGIPTRPR